mgnify:CR=1 FL=1
MSKPVTLPRWIDILLIPILNLLTAFVVSGLVITALGENPFFALSVMLKGAFYYPGSIGYTLYYTTNFMFTGLAVALAFHARLFNIGAAGPAYIGGLGVAVFCLSLDHYLYSWIVVILAIFGAFLPIAHVANLPSANNGAAIFCSFIVN